MSRRLMSGNEAVARGAWESGVHVATGYPGTPSTEILENAADYKDIDAQWSPNEKVALEVAAGASIGGCRCLVTMKHVGVNVAADPLFTLSYTGVNGGLVVVSADDPGMHSSQNEQDNRYYARSAKIPFLEPSDSQEAKDFVGEALSISETFDTPVMLRLTTRICHGKSLVELGERTEVAVRPYVKNPEKYVMVPAYGRRRHVSVQERLARLQAHSERSGLNRIEPPLISGGNSEIGIITSGVCYQYVRELLPQFPVLKLGLPHPLPLELMRRFAHGKRRILVVEELEPFIEDQLRALDLNGVQIHGRDVFPATGELEPGVMAPCLVVAFREWGLSPSERLEQIGKVSAQQPVALPPRPPVMCPGCPHRGVFYVLKRLKLTVTGDIGCYTLGALPPLEAMDTCICMGASVGAALGFEKARPDRRGSTVAVIGDSTFVHSGITGLIDLVYNQGETTVVIVDNRTTAMTGHQDHPASGRNLRGEDAPEVDLEALCRAIGVDDVSVVDPFDLQALENTLKRSLEHRGPSVVIARSPCALLPYREAATEVSLNMGACTGCRACLRLGCPALTPKGRQVALNRSLCSNCGLCVQLCRAGALAVRG